MSTCPDHPCVFPGSPGPAGSAEIHDATKTEVGEPCIRRISVAARAAHAPHEGVPGTAARHARGVVLVACRILERVSFSRRGCLVCNIGAPLPHASHHVTHAVGAAAARETA